MAHGSLFTTYVIDTSLDSENTISLLEQLWSDKIITTLEHLSNGGESTSCHDVDLIKNGLGNDEIDDLIAELEDYSFEECDYPEFFKPVISVSENGRITLAIDSEGEYAHLECTIGYSALAIQRHFGVKEYYSRCNVVETRNKQYIHVARINNSMQEETIFMSH